MITVGKFKDSQYTGVDISDGMIKQAKLKYPDYTFHNLRKHNPLGNKKFDLVLGVFGLINYMGVQEFELLLDAYLKEDGNFFAVMYSEFYKPNYLNGEAHVFSIDEVSNYLLEYGWQHEVTGLSYDMPMESSKFDSLYEMQSILSLSQKTTECKYWILKS